MAVAGSIQRRDGGGTVLGQVALDPALFGIEPNVAVMHQVVTAQLAAARSGTQSTLTRAEVRGGGRKPWAQKGTGRARQGSIRAPHWVGGGVALGPKPRDYRQKTPKKMVALALRSALSDRAAESHVVVVDDWGFQAPSTKAAVAFLDALSLNGRVLVVVGHQDDIAIRSFANLSRVQVMLASELNAYDILCNDWVVFTDATLPGTNETGPVESAPDKGSTIESGATEPDPAGSGAESTSTEVGAAEPAAGEANGDTPDEEAGA
ncbi:MAG: 50S ribosomal protein L4 [Acidimicrobiales bacterium]